MLCSHASAKTFKEEALWFNLLFQEIDGTREKMRSRKALLSEEWRAKGEGYV